MRDNVRVLESDLKDHEENKKVLKKIYSSLNGWKVVLERLKIYIAKCRFPLKIAHFYLITVSWLSLPWNTSKES